MFARELTTAGGGTRSDLTRADVEYFFSKTFGIDLKKLQENALLAALPELNVLIDDDVAALHPHLDNSPSRTALPFYTADDLKFATGQNFVAIVPITVDLSPLQNYFTRIWQSGDALLILAKNYGEPSPTPRPCSPDWMSLVNATDGWSLEKKGGADYVCHLRRNESSPYLTTLETKPVHARVN